MARVDEIGVGTPGVDEVIVHGISFVEVVYAKATGTQALEVMESGAAMAFAAAPADLELEVGDLVTVDRRENQWWIGRRVGSVS